ncbi:MAG: sulfatase [Candidatus Brocadiia bacterium]
MNLVVICTDTFRADYMGCYGNDWIETPNLDRFAERSIVFESAWGESLPTVQARRVYFTGRSLLPYDEDEVQPKGVYPPLPGWMPLEEDDVSLSEVLKEQGYFTGLVTDLWHYFKPAMNLHRGFDTWEFIRGQESDPWKSAPEGTFDTRQYVPEHMWDERVHERLSQYLRNTQDFHSEEDYFCARTFRTAGRWLENNADKRPFFLWVDTFDPHEPFDCPPDYAAKYHDDYPCERFIFLYGIAQENIREEDIPAIRGMYCGLLTLVDRWAGHLLNTIERLGLLEDTIVVFTTDHGTEFGEHGHVQKDAHLLHPPCVRLPLIIHHPDPALESRRVTEFASAVDLMPTLLNQLGVEGPHRMTGRDVWPTVEGEAVRDHVVSGFGWWGSVRTGEWNYIFPTRREDADEPGRLFHRTEDPDEMDDVADQHPDVVKEMRRLAAETWPHLRP